MLLTIYNDTAKDLKWSYKNKGNKEKIRPLKNLVPAWRNKYIIIVFKLLPTSLNTSPECLFTAALTTEIPKKASRKYVLSVWEYKLKLA